MSKKIIMKNVLHKTVDLMVKTAKTMVQAEE